jgi:uncharacterized protein
MPSFEKDDLFFFYRHTKIKVDVGGVPLKMHVMQDPVHGLMRFEKIEKERFRAVLDHPLFQRLRSIKQMGMADLIFPGAVHTRFNHSVGVAHVAECILGALDRHGFSVPDPSSVILAALLHDVGHGPFSHAFEALTPSICHEDWGLMVQNKLHAEGCCDRLIEPIPLVQELIASQLDADRMDYMLRDAHFCGVAYGRFDWDWLLHCLRPVEHQGHVHLGISEKGVAVVDAYLLARQWMIQNIYYHPKVRCVQSMMMLFLRYCCEAIEEAEFSFLKETALGTFLRGLSAYRAGFYSKAEFMEAHFSSYMALSDGVISACLERVACTATHFAPNIGGLAQALYYRRLPKILSVSHEDPETILALAHTLADLQEETQCFEWQCGLQCQEGVVYQKEEPILIKDARGHIRPLSFRHEPAFKQFSVYMDKTVFTRNNLLDKQWDRLLSGVDSL